MSTFTLEPTRHDLFLSLALKKLAAAQAELKLVGADGGMPFPDCVTRPPPVIASYRADAVALEGDRFWIVEVKSVSDLSSEHTKKQATVIRQAVSENLDLCFCLAVFGPDAREARLPPALKWVLTHPRCTVFHFDPNAETL